MIIDEIELLTRVKDKFIIVTHQWWNKYEAYTMCIFDYPRFYDEDKETGEKLAISVEEYDLLIANNWLEKYDDSFYTNSNAGAALQLSKLGLAYLIVKTQSI